MTSPTPVPLVSATAVAAHLSDTAVADPEAKYGIYVAAVNELVPRIATSGPASQAVGALLLAARLYRRRQSPEGVATFTADAPVYVQRNDPDVALYLGLGAWAPPVVG